MAEDKLEYTIGIKSRSGNYSTTVKEMTKSHFNNYYDKVISNGGKVIGFTTKPI